MNATIDHIDRRTHLKIVIMALLAAAALLAVGKTARLAHFGTALEQPGHALARVTPAERPLPAPRPDVPIRRSN